MNFFRQVVKSYKRKHSIADREVSDLSYAIFPNSPNITRRYPGHFLSMRLGILSQISFKTMLLPILNLGLEKEISIFEKVWKKSLILQPKICANPEYM